ncbi:MAG TPA: hypothetical protein PLB89_07845 [Flavobacteriales bacterium]|nr:hypothetical protein [Flavobacteriales bacterium]
MTVPSPIRLRWWPLPVFIALAFLIFWPTLGFLAFSDDHSALWNSGVRGIPWRNGFFRPLSDLTFRAVHSFCGSSPWEQRAFNVALHGANAFLLFAFFVRYVGRSSASAWPGAWLAGLLFIIYPFHQESIVWIVGRESSLGTFFVLLGLLLLNGPGPQWRRIGTSCASMFVGALCYESALLLPFLVIPLARYGLFELPTAPRKLGFAFGAVIALYALLWLLQGHQAGGSYLGGFLEKDPMALVASIPKVIARLFLPPLDPVYMKVAATALFLAITVVVVVTWRSTRDERTGRSGILAMVLLLAIACVLPVVGGVSTRTSESDRFLYMPSAFLCVTLAMLITRILQRWVHHSVVLCVVLGSIALLRANHRNWEHASATTARILSQLPSPPRNGRLFISGLPDSYCGAFIFRNGFREAVHLRGLDGDRYIPVIAMGRPGLVHFRDEDIVPGPDDRWLVWREEEFHER